MLERRRATILVCVSVGLSVTTLAATWYHAKQGTYLLLSWFSGTIKVSNEDGQSQLCYISQVILVAAVRCAKVFLSLCKTACISLPLTCWIEVVLTKQTASYSLSCGGLYRERART